MYKLSLVVSQCGRPVAQKDFAEARTGLCPPELDVCALAAPVSTAEMAQRRIPFCQDKYLR